MDRSIEPVAPRVRILPPDRRKDRRGRTRFVVDGEARPPAEEPSDDEPRSLGPPTDEEAGTRLDVTA